MMLSSAGAAQQDVAEAFSALPRVWDAALSPSGRYVATGCSPRGQREVCIYDLEGDDASRLIQQPQGGRIVGFQWANEDYLLYWIDAYREEATVDGMLRFTTRRILSYALETQRSALMLRQVTNVTSAGDLASVLANDDAHIAMELTLNVDDSPRGGSRIGSRRSLESVVYAIELDDGGLGDVLHTSNGSVLDYVLDGNGERLAEARFSDSGGRYEIWSNSGGRLREIYTGQFPSNPPSILGLMDEDASIALWISGQGLRKMDLETGTLSPVEVDGVDMSQAGTILDPRTNRLIGFTTGQGQVFLDRMLASLLSQLHQLLEEDEIEIVSWSDDRRKLVIDARRPGQPSTFYLLDIDAGALGELDVAYELPAGSIPSREYLTYVASDGLEIGAWLSLPPGQAHAQGLPLVVMPHGGPASFDTQDFDWWASAYAAMGYAVLQPNFRGSTGYGADFQAAGYGEFGGRMIDDIIDGAHHLQSQGIARDGSYCVAGASYGGYAALMTALRDPQNVACVVSFAGVTDPFAMLADSYAGATVRYWETYMGSRFSDAGYRTSITPVDRASELGLPLLVMHGNEDTTVPVGQMQALQRVMRSRDNARFITLEGEDHFMRTAAVRNRLLTESGAFLYEHLPLD